MSGKSKREVLARYAKLYAAAPPQQKKRLLGAFVELTGYHRKYAIALLNHPPPQRSGPIRRPRAKQYGPACVRALTRLWKAANCICAKRLKPFLPEFMEALERHGELDLPPAVRAQVSGMSAATIDRMLRRVRHHREWLHLGTTKPGTLLKHQIPVRTFADWDASRSGFVEVDLVAHCGPSTQGEYLHSLVLTDIATTWSECVPLLNRGQVAVTDAIRQVRRVLPFSLLGLDSDNGSEFINAHLKSYCEKQGITFTRGRPYNKNDQCFVEQKNYTVVRQVVGYDRFEGEAPYAAMWGLYRKLRLYVNFFQPSQKLVSKTRQGSRVRRTYDAARTPYRRVLARPDIPEATKHRLTELYESLNPAALLEQVQFLQRQLGNMATVRNANEATITGK